MSQKSPGLNPSTEMHLRRYVQTTRAQQPELYENENEDQTYAKIVAGYQAELAAIVSNERPEATEGPSREQLRRQFQERLAAIDLDEKAWNVLEGFALLTQRQISRNVCDKWLNQDAHLAESANIYPQLSYLGLLEVVPANDYRLHPVLAELIREQRQICLADHQYLAWQVANSLKDYPAAANPENWHIYLPRLETLADRLYCADERIGILYLRIGLFYAQYDKHEPAAVYFAKAEDVFAQAAPTTVTSHMELGQMYACQGNTQQAHHHFQQARECYQAHLPASKPSLTAKYQAAMAAGQHSEALAYAQQAYNAGLIWGYDDYSEQDINQALASL